MATSRFVGITGTPGTGKKTIAPLVAATMEMPSVSLSEHALANRLVGTGEDEGGVNSVALGRSVLNHVEPPALIFGHLFPYAFGPRVVNRVAVLRCEPGFLKSRLEQRGYSHGKVRENVEAELIGLLADASRGKFGQDRTAEFDTTRTLPAEIAPSIAEFFRGSRAPTNRIDWIPTYDSASKLRSLFS